jgi:hypothetical protein
VLEMFGKKAAKYLLYAIFPFAAPLMAAYDFLTDSSTHLEPKNMNNLLETGFAMNDFRFKREMVSLSRRIPNISKQNSIF